MRMIPMRLLAVVGTLVLTLVAFAQDTPENKIARAMSAAPTNISAEATIVDVDGTVLREGSNGWICVPGVVPGDNHPLCNDAVWTELFAAFAAGEPFEAKTIGISYMLQGDMRVNNADPADMEESEGEVWVQEGPHLMIVVPKALLEGMSRDPYNGGPYVMWGDTPYAHIMVPITNDNEG